MNMPTWNLHTLHTFWARAVQTARLSCGMPDYDAYVKHLSKHHPERKPPSYKEFFRERQEARYKGGGVVDGLAMRGTLVMKLRADAEERAGASSITRKRPVTRRPPKAEIVPDTFSPACIHLHGKGRKQRTMPLWRSTVRAIRAWLRLNPELVPASALLPNRDGHPMTRTNVTQRLKLAVIAASPAMPSLRDRHISPHTVRHTTAMHLLQSGESIEGIALWLGHESPTTTHQYVEASLEMKEKALAKLQDPDTPARRFRASDSLLEFLKTL